MDLRFVFEFRILEMFTCFNIYLRLKSRGDWCIVFEDLDVGIV